MESDINCWNTFLGERSQVIKRDDNLHPEGEFHKRPDTIWSQGERADVIRRGDNLQPEGDFSKRVNGEWLPGKILFLILVGKHNTAQTWFQGQ